MKRLWLLPLLLAAVPSCTAFQTVVGTPSRLSQAVSTSFRATRPASVRGLTCTAVKAEGAEDAAFTPTPPPVSVASGLPNKIYMWRGQQVRYQVAGPPDAKQAAVLVHGLFVNADQWRSTLQGLGEAGYRVYALDLLGCGWSSKPPRDSPAAQRLNGENGRFLGCTSPAAVEKQTRGPAVLPSIELGTASGGSRTADVDLRHPLGSPYNFYTWSEQIVDFTRDVVLAEGSSSRASLVANSIGTISSLQVYTRTHTHTSSTLHLGRWRAYSLSCLLERDSAC